MRGCNYTHSLTGNYFVKPDNKHFLIRNINNSATEKNNGEFFLKPYVTESEDV